MFRYIDGKILWQTTEVTWKVLRNAFEGRYEKYQSLICALVMLAILVVAAVSISLAFQTGNIAWWFAMLLIWPLLELFGRCSRIKERHADAISKLIVGSSPWQASFISEDSEIFRAIMAPRLIAHFVDDRREFVDGEAAWVFDQYLAEAYALRSNYLKGIEKFGPVDVDSINRRYAYELELTKRAESFSDQLARELRVDFGDYFAVRRKELSESADNRHV